MYTVYYPQPASTSTIYHLEDHIKVSHITKGTIMAKDCIEVRLSYCWALQQILPQSNARVDIQNMVFHVVAQHSIAPVAYRPSQQNATHHSRADTGLSVGLHEQHSMAQHSIPQHSAAQLKRKAMFVSCNVFHILGGN